MIIVESRELNNEDGQDIYHMLGEPQVSLFEHGDYLIRHEGLVALIERVTGEGLLQDIASGRIYLKLQGCSENADIVILLIERLVLPIIGENAGVQKRIDWEDDDIILRMRETGWKYNSVAEFLTSASLRWVHKIEWTLSTWYTAQRLLELDRYLETAKHELPMMRTRPFRMNSCLGPSRDIDTPQALWERQKYILMGFPDVADGLAGKIMDHFGYAPLQWTVSESQLTEVNGIGKVTARQLLQCLP